MHTSAIHQRARLQSLVPLLLLAACDGGGGPIEPAVLQFQIAGGDHQVGPASSMLPDPLSVLVTDGNGRPVSNISIRWKAETGTPTSATSLTNAAGVASIQRTLGADAGVQTTVAIQDDVPGREIRFTSVALVQGATQMARSVEDDGIPRTDTVLATLPSPLSVWIRDYNDTPVPGVVVEWRSDGNGTPSSATSTTDASGVAQTTLTFGPHASPVTVRAAVPGLAGSPVTFHATALPGLPTELALHGGDGRLGTILSALPPYEVRAADAYGNDVPGVLVTWTLESGDGFVFPGASVTAGGGIATATHTLGPIEGSHTVAATASGLPGAPRVTFTSTAVSALVSVMDGEDCYYDYSCYGPREPAFSPSTTFAKAGSTVAWLWDGVDEHDVVFEDDPTQPVSSPLQRTGRHLRAFPIPGTYRYRCTVHSTDFATGMVGQVIVLP